MLFLKTSQNSQENTSALVSFLIKLQAESSSIIKKETVALVLSCEFAKFLRTHFIIERLRLLRFSGCITKFLNIFLKS